MTSPICSCSYFPIALTAQVYTTMIEKHMGAGRHLAKEEWKKGQKEKRKKTISERRKKWRVGDIEPEVSLLN